MTTPELITQLGFKGCPKLAVILEYSADVSIKSDPLLFAFLKDNVKDVKDAIVVPFVSGSNVPELVASHISTKCQLPVIQSIDQVSAPSIVHVSLNGYKSNLASLQSSINALKEQFGAQNVDLMFIGSQSDRYLTRKRLFRNVPAKTPFNKRALFERYVFFNDAVLGGAVVMSVLFVIIYFAISEVSGIQAPTRFETKPRN